MYFSFDIFEGEYLFHDSEAKAIEEVKNIIDYYHSEGIPEDMTGRIGYGKVTESVVQKTIAEKDKMSEEEWSENGYSDEFDYICELTLV